MHTDSIPICAARRSNFSRSPNIGRARKYPLLARRPSVWQVVGIRREGPIHPVRIPRGDRWLIGPHVGGKGRPRRTVLIGSAEHPATLTAAITVDDGSQPVRITKCQRLPRDVGVCIRATVQANWVTLSVFPDTWVVLPEVVVVKPGLRVVPLARQS